MSQERSCGRVTVAGLRLLNWAFPTGPGGPQTRSHQVIRIRFRPDRPASSSCQPPHQSTTQVLSRSGCTSSVVPTCRRLDSACLEQAKAIGLLFWTTMAFSLRHSGPALSPTTQLVNALINFGADEPSSTASPAPTRPSPSQAQADADEVDPELDNEEDDIVAGGQKANTTTAQPKATSTDRLDGEAPTSQFVQLSVEGQAVAGPSAPPAAKVPRSLKSLLRSSNHSLTINTDTGLMKRTLTSWKMADYAYKRDPCPFPTRARGLFTEKVEGGAGADEYRIVARGYDKFFNVGEVSWTQVSTATAWLSRESGRCMLTGAICAFAVGQHLQALFRPVRVDAEVKWVHHPHFFTFSQAYSRHFQTLGRSQRQPSD